MNATNLSDVDRSTSQEEENSIHNRSYGDGCQKQKSKEVVRVMFQNVNGLGYSHGSVKFQSMKDLMKEYKVDIMAIAETNVNWGKLRSANSLSQRCRKWFKESKTVVSYNQHQRRTNSKHQPGGTAVMAVGEVSQRVCNSNYDKRRMGRWASQVFQGKQGIITRVVAVYVPIIVSKHGHKKVACQQQRVLLGMGITDNVISVFWEDFWKQVDLWIEAGDQLVIAGDWNKDVTQTSFLEEFNNRNLIPTTVSKHGINLPSTHNSGSHAIDEIFCTQSLDIVASGYLEHGASLSDHRAIWVDISKITLVGDKTRLRNTYTPRRLKTNDPRIVKRYVQRLHQELDKNNVIDRVCKLAKEVFNEKPLSSVQIEEYEKLDKLRHNAMKTAEQNCRKLRMGGVAWSPKLQNVRNKIEYLTLSRRRLLGRKVSAKILLRLSKKVNCNASHMKLSQVDKGIKELYKEYRKVKQDSYQLRSTFLSELADALEAEGKGSKSSMIKQLLAAESQRALFRKLAHIHKKKQDLSTKFITVETAEGPRKISNKKDMETTIIKENKGKYHQTESTCPFMKGPLKKDFGEMGIGVGTEKVLSGKYQPSPFLTAQTKDYIEVCKMPKSNLYINPFTRSMEYFTDSWKKMREKTASNDVHFGHFKSAVKDDHLMQLHYQLAEIPFRTGYSPLRWKNATNVMILKKEGDARIDKLRTLVLFESDFNHNNKFLGRQMMHHMADKGYLATEQYSAPGKKCIDHVINRKLYFDLIRYQKTSAGMAGVDLKSCYDRVSHAPAYLAMRSYGIPSTPIESMFKTIQGMRYYTFTSHGKSKQSFGGKEDNFIAAPNGLGQGNGAAPSAWTVVSTKMFEVMHKRGASTTLSSPLTNSKVDVCGFAFVDDTDLISLTKGVNDENLAQKKMQHNINEWEAISKTTGGALVPSKCWSWIIAFDWEDDVWSYKDTSSPRDPMTVKDANGRTTIMESLPAHKAKEMLGVRLAPDGNQKAQFQAAKDKMTKLAEYIRTGHVNRREAWVSLSMVAMKSLEYMLPAMTLSQEQYKQIMSPILAQFLPKVGLNRNVPRDLLYAPSYVQGLDLKDPYIMQGVNHIKDISENCWKETLTGSLLKCNFEQLRLEMGTNDSILNSDYNIYNDWLLTDSYVRSTWEFMHKHSICMSDDTATVPTLHEGDDCIMRLFMAHKDIVKSSLSQLNRCRMYLQVFTLSDIITGDGKKIRIEAWNGRKYDTGRDNSQWPMWGRPSLQNWTVWRTALKTVLCSKYDRMVDQPLGSWTHIPVQWKWYSLVENEHVRLIRKQGDSYVEHKKIGRSKLQQRYCTEGITVDMNKKVRLIPTTIEKGHKSLIMSYPTSIADCTKDREKPHQTPWLHISKLNSGSMMQLASDIRRGKAIAVSDGSYSELKGIGTASWVLSTASNTSFITAGAISPGPPNIQTSYRSEILGLLGILEALDNFCTKWDIHNGKCTIYCDGLSALEKVMTATLASVNTRQKCCDLISACVKLKLNIPIDLAFAHVKGHQDDAIAIHNLSVPAQLNVLMDNLAKSLLADTDTDAAVSLGGHRLGFSLPVHTHVIHQQMKETLYDSISIEKGHKYWISKERYGVHDISSIDWKAQDATMKTTDRSRRRTISKWCSGWLGTGKNMKRWNMRYSSNCVFCRYPTEDTNHVMKCTHLKPTENWKKLLVQFDKDLIKLKTSFQLRKAIILELRAWRTGNKAPSHLSAEETLCNAIQEQRQLGWRQFAEGLLVHSIIQYQQEYFTRYYPRMKGSTWARRVIKCSWKLILGMWEHRNEELHQIDNIEILQGSEILEETVMKEWDIGLGKLPILEYAHLFRLKKKELKDKSTQCKKDWLLTVKLGRLLHKDHSSTEDAFDSNKALRNWIGLPKLVEKRRRNKRRKIK